MASVCISQWWLASTAFWVLLLMFAGVATLAWFSYVYLRDAKPQQVQQWHLWVGVGSLIATVLFGALGVWTTMRAHSAQRMHARRQVQDLSIRRVGQTVSEAPVAQAPYEPPAGVYAASPPQSPMKPKVAESYGFLPAVSDDESTEQYSQLPIKPEPVPRPVSRPLPATPSRFGRLPSPPQQQQQQQVQSLY